MGLTKKEMLQIGEREIDKLEKIYSTFSPEAKFIFGLTCITFGYIIEKQNERVI